MAILAPGVSFGAFRGGREVFLPASISLAAGYFAWRNRWIFAPSETVSAFGGDFSARLIA